MHVVRGNGSIERRGPNTWRIRLAIGKDPVTGKYRQVSRTIHGSKADAIRAREKLRHEIEAGIDTEAGRMLFSEFAAEFIENRLTGGTIKEVTIVGDRMIIKRLLRYFGNIELRGFSVPLLIRAQVQMREDGFSQTMLHTTMRKLSQILKQAVRYDFIPSNPCDKIDIPRIAERSLTVLDAEGVRHLLNVLEQREKKLRHEEVGPCRALLERSRLMACHLAIATGMRRGEILGLTWKGVNLETGALRITQQYSTDAVLRPPKTRSGVRTISLDAGILARLRSWKAWQEETMGGLRIPFTPDTPVVANTVGDHANPGDFTMWWIGVREEAGFPRLRFHDLRHTQATLLIGNGVDIKTVQGRLGHSKAATTLDIYAGALPENDRKAAELLRTIITEQKQ